MLRVSSTRGPFVAASSQKIDFAVSGRKGEMVEAIGQVVRVGRSSIGVEFELFA